MLACLRKRRPPGWMTRSGRTDRRRIMAIRPSATSTAPGSPWTSPGSVDTLIHESGGSPSLMG